jgi:7-keto-8-aminopelargonate synthetase-like enzyme
MQRELRRLGFNTGHSNSPIIPIVVGDDAKTFTFWKALLEAGLFTNPVISPAVAPGNQLIRTSYMATHTDEQLDQVLGILERVGRQFGLIAPSRGFLACGCE